MTQGEWYYCLDHAAVEPYEACPSGSRLGPYPTAGEAADALARAKERNAEWEHDPRFVDPDDEGPEETEGWGPFRH